MGIALFKRAPKSEEVCQFLGQVIGKVGAAPKYLVTDQGKQFSSQGFRSWCLRHAIRQRLGAVGKHGSIAVAERFIRTLKESMRTLTQVPLLRRSFYREVTLTVCWYNTSRPHMTLKGATPDEVYFRRRPACRQPRFEPRPDWPRAASCAKPRVLVKGQPGVVLEMSVDFFAQRRDLPLVTLKRAA